MTNKKIVSVFALLNEDNEVVGYFKDEQKCLDHVERNNMDCGVVLEIVGAFDIVAPPEPEYELENKALLDLLDLFA